MYMSLFKPISQAPKDGRKLLLWRPMGFWIGSWRLPESGEPNADSHYEYEWRDESGRWATAVLFMELPTTVELNRILRKHKIKLPNFV